MMRPTAEREAGFVTVQGTERGSGQQILESRFWVERQSRQPSRGGNGEWAKKRRPRRKTDRQAARPAVFVGFSQEGSGQAWLRDPAPFLSTSLT